MFESDENFTLALNESGIKIHIPRQKIPISDEQLQEFDAMYAYTEDMGPALGQRSTQWGLLVEELRQIRRLIEADIIIEIEGRTFNQVGSFLNWAHKRYHALEDGYDSWIGDDKS